MGFSRQEYRSGLPCLPPWNLSDPGIKSSSLASPALAGRLFTTNVTQEAHAPTLLRPLISWPLYFSLSINLPYFCFLLKPHQIHGPLCQSLSRQHPKLTDLSHLFITLSLGGKNKSWKNSLLYFFFHVSTSAAKHNWRRIPPA